MTEIFGLFNREYFLWAILPLAEICDLSYVVRARFNFTASSLPPTLRKNIKAQARTSARFFPNHYSVVDRQKQDSPS